MAQNYLPYIKKIKLIRPLDYVPYNKDFAMQFLVDKFDIRNIHKNTLNQGLLGFMKVTGYQKIWI